MEIVYYAASTLDGYIADEAGGVGFLDPFGGEGEDHGFVEFYASIDSVIMGRATYEVSLELSESWPFGDRPSYVLSSRELKLVHPSIRRREDGPREVVEALEEMGHTRAWLLGGGKLAASFVDAGLLSECIIGVVPVVLGSGIPLFGPLKSPNTLQHRSSESYPSGLVLMRYGVGHADAQTA